MSTPPQIDHVLGTINVAVVNPDAIQRYGLGMNRQIGHSGFSFAILTIVPGR
jgi:hypothetical protein